MLWEDSLHLFCKSVNKLTTTSNLLRLKYFTIFFTSLVLNDLLLEGSPNVFINQNDLLVYLEHNFEGIDLPNIEGLIKSYFSLFDTEGNRHHD